MISRWQRPLSTGRSVRLQRNNYTHDHRSSSGVGRDSEPPSTSQKHSVDRPRDCIFIKSWDTIGSLADAYAIVRAVERKYGRFREYRFWRDGERPQILQTHITAVFRSPESFQKVPAEGEVLHIPAPQVDPDQDGGVGLEDLQGLLEPQDINNEVELPGWGSVMSRVLESGQHGASKRILDVKVERAVRNWQYSSSIDRAMFTRARLRAIGHAFREWGGFYNDNSIATTQSQSHQECMHKALTKWEQFMGTSPPSTSELEPASATSPSELIKELDGDAWSKAPSPFSAKARNTPVEWDPIPDAPNVNDATSAIPFIEIEALESDLQNDGQPHLDPLKKR